MVRRAQCHQNRNGVIVGAWEEGSKVGTVSSVWERGVEVGTVTFVQE